MLVNLHTHTPRCRHATGTEEEYIQYALQAGLHTLGFSDHTPYCFPGDYYTHMRMYPDELADYVDAVQKMQKKYADSLDIRLGLEVEYYPAYFRELLPMLQDNGITYMLLGQHWCGNEIDEPYNGRPTEDTALLRKYCDQVIAAMETGLFTYVAHPDLLYFTGDPKAYESHMRRLCKAAKQCNMPLEMNLLGMREGRQYPNMTFWQVAAEENCSVVLGCDAHRPCDLDDKETEQTALSWIRQLGLALLETPQIRSI